MGGSPVDGGANAGGSISVGGNTTNGGGPSGGATPGGGYEDGNRLKVRTRVGADGSRQPIGWYDANLDTVCTWRRASDGAERCIPDGIVANRFVDDECTQPILVQSSCDPLQFALVTEDPDGCGNRWRAFPIGSAITPATAYMKSGANCVATGAPAGSLFGTNAELPASSFVTATVEIEP